MLEFEVRNVGRLTGGFHFYKWKYVSVRKVYVIFGLPFSRLLRSWLVVVYRRLGALLVPSSRVRQSGKKYRGIFFRLFGFRNVPGLNSGDV